MSEKNEIQKKELPMSERFTNAVITEFSATAGGITLSPHQRKLAQHLFVKVDTQMKELEAKRSGSGMPIVWENINMPKLALDAVHRIELGLDALISNHIHPIPYWDNKLKKYDMDLRIGYVGKLFYRVALAIDPPLNVIIELVYSNDTFRPIKKSIESKIEDYEFKVTTPFDRGTIIGGFGYIMYDNPAKNKLILASEKDFKKSKDKAKTDTFWKPYETEMRYKTLVHRVTNRIDIDPSKVPESVAAIEAQDFEREIDENANQTVIGIDGDGEQGDTKSGEVMEEAQTTETATVKTEDVETTKINKPGPGF